MFCLLKSGNEKSVVFLSFEDANFPFDCPSKEGEAKFVFVGFESSKPFFFQAEDGIRDRVM